MNEPYDVYARLYDPLGVLAIKLGQEHDAGSES